MTMKSHRSVEPGCPSSDRYGVLGDVGAENLDSLVDGDAFFFDHIAEFCEHGMLIADADANRVTGFVEHRHAAVAIGAHGDMGKRNTASRAAFAALLGFTAFSEPGCSGRCRK